MTKSSRIMLIVLPIIAMSRTTWCHCTITEEDKDNYDGVTTIYKYKCSFLSRQDFSSEINPIINNKLVRDLELYKINLTYIDQNLFSNSRFKEVYDNLIIKDCGTTKIEQGSFDNFFLTDNVYILDNNITYFDGQVLKDLEHLDLLDLTNNNIEKFNINCFNNKNFTILILNNNLFANISNDNFINCTELRNISMKNCKLGNIDNVTFNSFHNLTYLDLQNNNLKNLKFLNDAFTNTLSSLNVENNSITEFPCAVFSQNNSLIELNLNSNQIKDINKCAFQNLYLLIKLHLKNNGILFINPEIFKSQINLKYLDLSENKLRNFDEPLAYFLEPVEILDLSLNYIANIKSEYVFSYLKNLKYIDLSGNSWSCKNLTLILHYLHSRNVNYTSKTENFNSHYVAGIECITIFDNENTELPDTQIYENNVSNNRLRDIVTILTKIKKNQNENGVYLKEFQNSVMNILYLLIIISICFICYKIVCYVYKYYKAKSRNKFVEKENYAPNDMELLSPETNMN